MRFVKRKIKTGHVHLLDLDGDMHKYVCGLSAQSDDSSWGVRLGVCKTCRKHSRGRGRQ